MRLPAIFSLLGCCLLIFSLLRRYVSALAALFAAVCFIVSPMVLQRIITAEPDVMVSFILFGTFIVWWNGVANERIGPERWLAIGVLLSLAALVKGPQPIAYYGLAAGAFHLWRRQWLDLVGLAFSGLIAGLVTIAWYWAVYQPGDLDFWLRASRIGIDVSLSSYVIGNLSAFGDLLLKVMPALFVVAPFVPRLLRERKNPSNALAIALLLYAMLASVALVLWPEPRGRYAMPGTVAFAALAGLAFEQFRITRPRLVNLTLVAMAALAAYQIALFWLVMPAFPDAFGRTRRASQVIQSVMQTQPATLYGFLESDERNIWAYIPQPIRVMRLAEFRTLAVPAWALASADVTDRLRELRPDIELIVRSRIPADDTLFLLEMRAKLP